MELLRFPLMRIGPLFILGLLTANLVPKVGVWVVIAIPVLSVCTIKWRKLSGLLILAAAFLTGGFVHNSHFSIPECHYSNFLSPDPQKVAGKIRERLRNGRDSHRYVIDIARIDGRGAKGKLLLNVRDHAQHLAPGTPVAFISAVQPNKRPANPGQFDYGKYLGNQMIKAQTYVNSDAIITGSPEPGLLHTCDMVRARIVEGLKNSGMQEKELRVANALILGQRQELDRTLVNEYEIAGAVHILSVSGLHVGFVMLVVNFVLRPVPRSRLGRRLRFIGQLTGLWGFALLTGLSPSVVRSAAMFSMLAAGESLRRASNRFHTLMASALLILIANPALILDVGFQLSYSAVLFIIWLYPAIRDWWAPNNTILQYFRDIAAVSIAAQVGTLPLCLYYFHQFPGLFLLTNLAIIPLVTVIMIVGLLVMMMAIIGRVPTLVVTVFEWSIRLLNYVIAQIASADKFALTEIPFTLSMAVSLIFLVISITVWFQRFRRKHVIWVLASVVWFQTTLFIERKSTISTSEFIVFHDRKTSLLTCRKGDALEIHCDSLADYHLKSYREQNFSGPAQLKKHANLLWFRGKKILVADSSLTQIAVNPDIVILRTSPRINLDRALSIWKPKLVVADGTNYKSYTARWKATCQKRKIPFHATGEKGSFILRESLLP